MLPAFVKIPRSLVCVRAAVALTRNVAQTAQTIFHWPVFHALAADFIV
jgi:hypothetical protein